MGTNQGTNTENQLQQPKVSINTLSCASSDLRNPQDVLWPPSVAAKMAENAGLVCDAMIDAGFERENVGVSLHAGLMVPFDTIYKHLYDKGINIHSLDGLDVNGPHQIYQILSSIAMRSKWPIFKGTMDHRIGMLASHAAWLFHNAPIDFFLNYRVNQAVEAGIRTIRATSSDFEGRTQGGVYLDILQQNPDVVLTVEQNANQHSLPEWMTLIDRLNNDYPGRVLASFDGAHAFRSTEMHRAESGGTVENFWDQILASSPQLIAAVEVNQPALGEIQTHQNLLNGPVDYKTILASLGRAHANGSLVRQPEVIFEPHPSQLKILTSESGITFMRGLRAAYQG